ncbi:MAG: hypothetical protein HZA04_07150 [Nitrospinae bacterium]|nr:hypothetical protein [Nitrospinota bacterium]
MIKKISVSALLAVIAFASSSCATPEMKVKVSLQQDKIIGDVNRNLRSVKVYRNLLDTILLADVLWYKPEIKKAVVDFGKADGRIDAEQEKKMLADIAEKDDKELEFIAGIVTGDIRWNDFEKEDSMWRVTLKTADGQLVTPLAVEKLKLNKMQDAWLFPFLTEWKSVYRIRFAKTPSLTGMDAYTLRFTSMAGEGTFNWETRQPK